MEGTVLERVNAVFVDLYPTKRNLANEIGMTETTVGRQLKGEQALSAKLVEGLMLAHQEISAEWLLRGKGDMYLCKPYSKTSMPTAMSEPLLATDPVQAKEEDSIWKAKYEELEKRYDQLLSILGGGMKQANVG